MTHPYIYIYICVFKPVQLVTVQEKCCYRPADASRGWLVYVMDAEECTQSAVSWISRLSFSFVCADL